MSSNEYNTCTICNYTFDPRNTDHLQVEGKCVCDCCNTAYSPEELAEELETSLEAVEVAAGLREAPVATDYESSVVDDLLSNGLLGEFTRGELGAPACDDLTEWVTIADKLIAELSKMRDEVSVRATEEAAQKAPSMLERAHTFYADEHTKCPRHFDHDDCIEDIHRMYGYAIARDVHNSIAKDIPELGLDLMPETTPTPAN